MAGPEYEGRETVAIENEHIRLVAVPSVGAITELFNKDTGHEQLLVRPAEIALGMPCLGWADEEPLRFYYRPHEAQVQEDAEAIELRLSAEGDGVRLIKTYRIPKGERRVESVASLSKTVQMTNVGEEVRTVGSRPVLHLAVASGGFLGHPGVLTAHYHHTLFYQIDTPFPAASYSASRVGVQEEAIQHRMQRLSYGTVYAEHPRWIAAVDPVEREGVVLLPRTPTAALKIEDQYFASAVTLSSGYRALGPGETLTYRVDLLLFQGLARVDHAAPSFLAAIEIPSTVVPDEVLKGTFRVLSLVRRPLKVRVDLIRDMMMDVIGKRGFTIDTAQTRRFVEEELVQEEAVIVEPGEVHSWGFETKPVRWATDRLIFGVMGVAADIDGTSFKRTFSVSKDVEIALETMRDRLKQAEGLYEAGDLPAEGLGTILALWRRAWRRKEDSDEINGFFREREDADAFYRLSHAMGHVLNAFEERRDWGYLPKGEALRVLLCEEPVRGCFEAMRAELDGRLDEEREQIDLGLLEHCAFCYAVTGEGRYLQRAIREVVRLYDRHQKYAHFGRSDSFDIGGGLGTLARAWDWLGEALPPEQHAQIVEYLLWVFSFYPSYASAPSENWDVTEAKGLLWAATRTGYLPESEEVVHHALLVLKAQLSQVYEDGAWPETSGYHFGMPHAFLEADRCLFWAGRSENLHEPFKGRSPRMLLEYSYASISQTLTTPAFGDAGHGRPSPQAFLLGAAVYGDPKLVWIAQQLADGPIPLRAPFDLITYPVGLTPEAPPPRLLFQVLKGAGRVVMRGGHGKDDVYLILDYGPHGLWHGHYDALGFELHAFGKPIAIDPGGGGYSHPIHFTWYRHTKAHNTVCADDQPQEEAEGRLRFGRDFGEACIAWVEAQTYEDGVQRRVIVYVRPDLLLVSDLVQAGGSHDWMWNLHADGEVSRGRSGEVDFLDDRDGIGLRVLVPSDSQVEVGEDPRRGEERYSHVSLLGRGERGLFSAVLIPYRGECPSVEARCSTVGEAAVAWTIQWAGKTCLCLVNYSGGAVRFGALETDAAVLLRLGDRIWTARLEA